jgi:hypothetical protein
MLLAGTFLPQPHLYLMARDMVCAALWYLHTLSAVAMHDTYYWLPGSTGHGLFRASGGEETFLSIEQDTLSRFGGIKLQPLRFFQLGFITEPTYALWIPVCIMCMLVVCINYMNTYSLYIEMALALT